MFEIKEKIIKPEKRCPTCNVITEHAETATFCDYCDKQMPKGNWIQTSIFKELYSFGSTEQFTFDTWDCFFAWLYSSEIQAKLKASNFGFLDFPPVQKSRLNEFLEALKKQRG